MKASTQPTTSNDKTKKIVFLLLLGEKVLPWLECPLAGPYQCRSLQTWDNFLGVPLALGKSFILRHLVFKGVDLQYFQTEIVQDKLSMVASAYIVCLLKNRERERER